MEVLRITREVLIVDFAKMGAPLGLRMGIGAVVLIPFFWEF